MRLRMQRPVMSTPWLIDIVLNVSPPPQRLVGKGGLSFCVHHWYGLEVPVE